MMGYGSAMMGGFGLFGLFGFAMLLVIFIDLVLLGIWLWKKISKE